MDEHQRRKEAPLFHGVLNYFPDALMEVSRLSRAGSLRHNGEEPIRWSRDISNDHLDCLARHLLEWDEVDDDGFVHMTKVAWRALAQLQIMLEEEDR